MADYITKGKPSNTELPRISVGKLIYKQFKKFENKISMVDGETDEKITYGEILTKSVKLADALKRLGLKQNDVIAQICPNNINYFVPFFASLYYGFIFNPINPQNTKYELNIYLNQTKPKCIFCTKSVISMILEIQLDFSCIDIIVVTDGTADDGYYSMETIIEEEPENPNFKPIDLDPEEQIATIIYSSGTTGIPKPVALSHKNIRSSFYAIGCEFTGFTQDDVNLFCLPSFHVISASIVGLIFNGIANVILRGFQPELFLSVIEKYHCSIAVLVPPILSFMCDSPLTDNYNLSSLKRIIYGSAPTSIEKMNTFMKKFQGAILNQIYGLSESTSIITKIQIRESNVDNVGRILPNVEKKVVDVKTGKSVGPNTSGELCIRGDFVFKEYYNDAKSTAASFDSEGFLKTGDIVYFDDQQRFYIVDRLKDIIKYKGYQVSPAEIESVLRLHKAVEDVGVIGIPDERAGEVPMAFVVKKEEVSEKELFDIVAEHLSAFKHLYGGIKFVQEIPRKTLIKVNRNALRQMWRESQNNIVKPS